MKEHFAIDRVVKDLFQTDHPSLFDRFTGGVPVRVFLNVEFQRVMERRADLVALLEDDSVFHLEIQAQNDKRIAYREGIYCLLIGYLIFRSTFLPRTLGVLMAIAGLGWLTFMSPTLTHSLYPYNLAPGIIGEGVLTLWLLAVGLNEQRWKEQEAAAA